MKSYQVNSRPSSYGSQSVATEDRPAWGMGTLFHWPVQALVGRVLTKKKLFEQSPAGAAVRELFTRQVDKIVWEAKLAESTVNLPKSPEAPEIQVFSIHLKGLEIHGDVLRFLDRAIPYPLIFELRGGDKVRMAAAHKRPGPTVEHKWIVGDYYFGLWLAAGTERQPLPAVLDLKSLYAALLAPLLPVPARPGENLGRTAERLARIGVLEKKIARLESQLNSEKQFNRRVEINSRLQALKQELSQLTQGEP